MARPRGAGSLRTHRGSGREGLICVRCRCLVARTLAVVASVVPATACSLGPDRDEARVVARLDAGPVLADEPLALRVSGAQPGARVTVEVRGGQQGATAAADFTVEDDGTVDLLDDPPAEGSSYTQASGYGLLWQLPAGDALGRIGVTVSVDGSEESQLSQVRALADDEVRSRRLRPAVDGLSGRYFAPADTTEERPAVVVFGGSEGGLSGEPEAALLASHGYPALALAYFDAPGLPERLRHIRVEYFELALAWLSMKPGVDQKRIVPYGISRGSEAALLVASLAPELAGGVIGVSPNGVALGSVLDITDPAWLWRGRPVPYAASLRDWWYEPGEAVIDVWDIDGPVLLVCGAADRVWSSCSQAEDVSDARIERGTSEATVVAFEGVGHEIGFAVPGAGGAGRLAGEDLERTGLARAEAWQAVLDYLADL